MRICKLLVVTSYLLLAPHLVLAQQFTQSSAAPLTQVGVGAAIDESGSGASIHILTWTTAGAPTSCTIALEMSSTAAGTFTPLGTPQNCALALHGSVSISGISPAFVRVNLQSLTGTMVSVSYTYTGMGTVTSAAFASASLWAKLDALRAVEALKHGIVTIQHCPMFSSAVGDSNAVPYPTDQEFQLYSEPFGSDLDIAASFGDTGANGIPSAQNTIQTEALGQIEFQSDHFFYNWKTCISHRPTLSFNGTVGLRPALVLENLSSTTTTIANPGARPMFQDAFGWSLGPRVNVATSHSSQLEAFATLGESYLISQVTSFKQGDNTVTATPVANKVGQSALYWESGLEWKLLNTDIVNAYINKTDILDPPFSVSFGYRHDGRFMQAGDLAGFSNPQAYMFFRFSVGLNKIINWNASTVEPGKGYTFKFGIDYEKPLGDSRMPTATRYYVSANFDIMHVFKPAAPAAPATPQPNVAPQPPPVARHSNFE